MLEFSVGSEPCCNGGRVVGEMDTVNFLASSPIVENTSKKEEAVLPEVTPTT